MGIFAIEAGSIRVHPKPHGFAVGFVCYCNNHLNRFHIGYSPGDVMRQRILKHRPPLIQYVLRFRVDEDLAYRCAQPINLVCGFVAVEIVLFIGCPDHRRSRATEPPRNVHKTSLFVTVAA